MTHVTRRAQIVVLAGGVVSLVASAAVGTIDPRTGRWTLLASVFVATSAYWVSWRGLASTSLSTLHVRMGLALAVLCRVWLVFQPPLLSDDLYRYLWDARVQQAGLSPYRSPPDDPALQSLHTPHTLLTNNPSLPTIYPPGAQWAFRAVALVTSTPTGLKTAFVACDLVLLWLYARWLAATGRPASRVLGLAWHPLLLVEVAGNGHVDVVGATWLMASRLFAIGGAPWAAGAAFGASLATKFVPLVLVPLLFTRRRWREVAAAAGAVTALAAPYVWQLKDWPLGSLTTYLEQWRFNSPLFDALESVAYTPRLPAIALASGLTAALAVRWWVRRDEPSNDRALSPTAWVLPISASFLLAPAVFPWYLLWLLPQALDACSSAWLIWTLTSLFTYHVWWVLTSTGAWYLPTWVLWVEYGAVAAGLIVSFVTASRSITDPTPTLR
ncbi:MAG: glycosyltransferase 87 family protein [Vicinamibacterales bacterium]